jgi:hypothetical protein
MGQEARCTVRFGDQIAKGKALLETDNLIFRSESLRLKITFKEMRSVEAARRRVAHRVRRRRGYLRPRPTV